MSEQLHFSYGEISSDTINGAIFRALYENHDIEAALKLAKGFTENNQQTEYEKTCMAYDILNSKAKIVGTFPNDDYGVDYPDDCSENHKITDELQKLADELENTRKELNELQHKWCFVCQDFSDYKRRNLDEEYFNIYDKHLFPPESLNLPNSRVQEFLNRAIAPADPDEYGWLEPNGTYHPVEWAKHGLWAKEYLEKHYPFEQNPELYWCEDNGVKTHIVNDEVLTRKLHWVLLHNPYQGKAQLSKDPLTRLTKAQKEFLYDYFTKRGRKKDADDIYKNEGD